MVSIYVTVPKKETKHFLRDKKLGLEKGRFIECYWDVGKKPRRLEEDDEIFFIVEGFMQFWAKVTNIQGSKVWFDKINESAEPMAVKSFRGFKYFRKPDSSHTEKSL